jgi:His/Glu/Gln/Arg/opine family amino acid ABC transporter permease subunit
VGISDLNLRVLIPYLPVLCWGAVRTLEISALAIALSFPLGLVGGLMRLSDNRLARSIATIYVETIRNIPLLVVLYILFLVLPLLRHSDQRPDRRGTGPGDQQHRVYDRDRPRRLCRNPFRPI